MSVSASLGSTRRTRRVSRLGMPSPGGTSRPDAPRFLRLTRPSCAALQGRHPRDWRVQCVTVWSPKVHSPDTQTLTFRFPPCHACVFPLPRPRPHPRHHPVTSLIAGRVGDVFGRRATIFAGACIFSLGGLFQAFTNGYRMMVFGRILSGFGVGFLSMCVPVYQSEISPAENRGRLGCIEFTVRRAVVPLAWPRHPRRV